MNLYNPPVDARLRDLADEQRIYCPIGHDAPKHSPDWANYQSAVIAAQEVYGKAIHSERHRQSLAAWQRGERSWPWPDATPDEQAVADREISSLLASFRLSDDEFLGLVKGQKKWTREFGR